MSDLAVLHPDLAELAPLLGEWEGDGEGSWEGRPRFRYREWLRFSHSGRPFLAYAQRTEAADDGRPLHAETGYWRPAPGGGVEVVIAHPIGVVEMQSGRWDGGRLRLRSTLVSTTATAKAVSALERDLEVDGDELTCALRMATGGGAPLPHLRSRLHRAGA